MTKPVLYMTSARNAADTERACNYRHAAVMWRNAGRNTANIKNQQWCENRAECCTRLAALRQVDEVKS